MPRAIAAIDRFMGAVAVAAAWLAVAVMVSITLLILTEIVLRSFFASSTQIVEEYVGYGLGAMVFLGLGQALRAGALVRVDLVLGKLPAGTRRPLEVVLCLVTLAAMGFIMRYLLISVLRNFERGTISMTRAATPMWIPEGLILAGMAIFTLTLLAYCLRLLAGGPLVQDSGRSE